MAEIEVVIFQYYLCYNSEEHFNYEKNDNYHFIKTLKENTFSYNFLNDESNFDSDQNENFLNNCQNKLIDFCSTFKSIESSNIKDEYIETNHFISNKKKLNLKTLLKKELNEQSLLCYSKEEGFKKDKLFFNLIVYKFMNYMLILNKLVCSKLMIDKKVVLLIEQLIHHCVSSESEYFEDKNSDLIVICCIVSFLSFFCNNLSLSKICEKTLEKYKIVKKTPDKNVFETRSQDLYELIKPINLTDLEFFFSIHFNPKFNQITRNIIIESIHTIFDETKIQYTSSFDIGFITYYYFHKTAFNTNYSQGQDSLFHFNDFSSSNINNGSFKTPKNSQNFNYSIQKNTKIKNQEDVSGTPKFNDKENSSPTKIEDFYRSNCQNFNLNSNLLSNSNFTKKLIKKSNEKSNSFSLEEPIRNLSKSLNNHNSLNLSDYNSLLLSSDSRKEFIDANAIESDQNKFILNSLKDRNKSSNSKNYDIFLKKLPSIKESESSRLNSNYSENNFNDYNDLLGFKRNKILEEDFSDKNTPLINKNLDLLKKKDIREVKIVDENKEKHLSNENTNEVPKEN